MDSIVLEMADACARQIDWAERFTKLGERQAELAERAMRQLMRSRELLSRTAKYYHTGML